MVDVLYSPGVIPSAYAPLVGVLSFGTLAVLGCASTPTSIQLTTAVQTLTVSKHRKASGIRYPQLCASLATVQRAHWRGSS